MRVVRHRGSLGAAAFAAAAAWLAACWYDVPDVVTDASGFDAGGDLVVLGDAPVDVLSCDATVCGASCADLSSDSKNCGACGHDCLGGTCSAGNCQPVALASNVSAPFHLAVDKTHVYWTAANGTIDACPIQGGCGSAPAVLASNQASPWGIAVDSTDVYWTDNVAGGNVMKCAVAGCALAAVASNQGSPRGIAVDATDVYWVNSSAGQLMQCPISGCPSGPTAVVTAGVPARETAIDSTSVYWTYPAGCNCSPNSVGRFVKATAASGAIASSQSSPDAVATDGTRVFWINDNDSTIGTCVAASCVPISFIGGQTFTKSAQLAVDATYLYWGSNGAVVRCDKTNCNSPAVVGSGMTTGLAVDAVAVYWGTANGVMMLVK